MLENSPQVYPKFIDDFPKGEDNFEGKPQEKIADEIIGFLTDNKNSKRRVIGIDGEWGSGKSNVIEIIKAKTNKQYQVFTFDVWGHQEDLTRRSFLEELVDELIKNQRLDIEWTKQLKQDLSTNIITSSKEVPELNPRIFIFGIILLLAPLLKSIAHDILNKFGFVKPDYLDILSTIVFLLFAYFIIFHVRNKSKTSLNEILSLYQGQRIQVRKHETISSLEPSVREFRAILNKIVADLDNRNVKLIIVFDNMDRLPARKVKEIWSSIYTFFAEAKNNEYKTWVIVPYDQSHICKIFEDEKAAEITASYIQKTFSLVFRISPPVLSDWKMFFRTKFLEAFNYDPPEDDHVINLFDYLHVSPTIKPREIINYINELVAYKKLWKEEIRLKYIGLFILRKDIIIKNPIQTILDKTFIKGVETLFEQDAELEKNISALVFNVKKEKADEVLLRRSIEKVLRGEGDFRELSKHTAFVSVLDSCYYNNQKNINNTIEAFSKLPVEIKSATDFQKYWNDITTLFINDPAIFFPNSESQFQILLLNNSNVSSRNNLLKTYLNQIRDHEDLVSGVMSGGLYSDEVDKLDQFIKQNNIGVNVFDHLQTLEFSPEDYIEFVENCKSPFEFYKISVNPEELLAHLIVAIPRSIRQLSKFLEITNSIFDYSAVKQKIARYLESINEPGDEYEIIVDDLLTIYKTLTAEKPIEKIFASPIALALLANRPVQQAAIDLYFIILSDKKSVAANITNARISSLSADLNYLSEAIRKAEYYITYGDLLLLALNYPKPLLISTVTSLTIKPSENFKFDPAETIKNYDKVREIVFQNNEELINVFLERLNDRFDILKEYIESNSFSEVISLNLFKDATVIRNSLTECIIEKANHFLANATKQQWENCFHDYSNSYQFAVFQFLLARNLFKLNSMPDFVINSYKSEMTAIAREGNTPTDLISWNKVFDLFAKKMKSTFEDIRQILLFDRGELKAEDILFFSYGFFRLGTLLEKKTVEYVCRRIIMPALKNKLLFEQVIIPYQNDVVKIVRLSTETFDEVKDVTRLSIRENNLSNFDHLINGLGIELDSYDPPVSSENQTP